MYDAIIIGSGQSGPFLAVRLANRGKKVVLFEREHFGGTCLNDGCTPTKTLVASARAAHVMAHAAQLGVNAAPFDGPRVDFAKVKARKDQLVKTSVDGLTRWLEGTENLSLVRGAARFVASHRVECEGNFYEAEQIFIDVGGRPSIPSMPGISEIPYLTNTSMMELDVLPEHLAIIGGSYIALEFAQMYRRFGSKVTVLQHGPRLIGKEDPDVSAAVKDILLAEGLRIHLQATDITFAKHGSVSCISFKAPDAQTLSASHVLIATGRVPNTDQLGLEAAGIDCDAHGFIRVDDRLQTSVKGVYAMGDVNGHAAFTHTSYQDYEIVAANLLDGGHRSLADRVLAYALYIDPPLGRVGMTETEVRKSGRPALMATLPMARVSRARERGETSGFMKVLVDANSEQILGASILGIEGDEVIQQLALAMTAKISWRVVRDVMGIHPTVSELLPTLFDGLKPLDRQSGDSGVQD
jgi:pyruvate/2-oxoglutarate dehydrogenase complex dihydrolipoamide dehydrogenase (E3) component